MPMNPRDYPAQWVALSKRIRLERAGGRCECTGQCSADHGGRCEARNGWGLTRGSGKVVLTVAHLCRPEDHDPPGKCSQEDHLLAMCQQCHLKLDHPIHVQHARETRERRAGFQELPGFTKGADHAPTVQEGRQPLHAAEPRHEEEEEPREGPLRENVPAEEPAPLIGPTREAPLPPFAPLVAVSDGSQDVNGVAPLSGTPLPAGFRLVNLRDGWTQSQAIEVCRDCRHGTVQVDPQGVSRHRSCSGAAGARGSE